MAEGKCAACGNEVPVFSLDCPHCGIALTWTGPGIKEIVATCPRCGRSTASPARACAHCGTPIDWAVTARNRSAARLPTSSAARMGRPSLGCLLTCFIAGPVLVFVVLVLFGGC